MHPYLCSSSSSSSPLIAAAVAKDVAEEILKSTVLLLGWGVYCSFSGVRLQTRTLLSSKPELINRSSGETLAQHILYIKKNEIVRTKKKDKEYENKACRLLI